MELPEDTYWEAMNMLPSKIEKANQRMVSPEQANNTISFDFLQVGDAYARV